MSEVAPTESVDIPDSSHDPNEQAVELEHAEYIPELAIQSDSDSLKKGNLFRSVEN